MTLLRKLAERLNREKAFIRKLPSEFLDTPLSVSPDAQLKHLKPGAEAFDKDLFDLVSEHITKDDVVWDIGANVGVFAFAAASVVGPTGYVLAIEPDIWLANLIQKSARLRANQELSLDVSPAAITDNCGIETFLVASRGRASNALAKVGGRTQMGGSCERNLVPAFTLDDLVQASAKPNFIKIDVEGAEVSVLRGGQRVLWEACPIIYCELGPEYRMEIAEIFQAADYKVFNSNLPKSSRFNREICEFNTLAYPSEFLKVNEYAHLSWNARPKFRPSWLSQMH